MKIIHSFFAKHRLFLIITATIFVLTSFRLVWIAYFTMSDAPDAVSGVLDLRDWKANGKDTITLDGEWEFYPHTFLKKDEINEGTKQFLNVPGSWNEALLSEEAQSFGYGTYRLRILVQQEEAINYSIRIPSVRSSSAVYVNGDLLAQSGQPAEDRTDYIARNVPYTATFNAGGLEEFEVMIHVANFKDTRDSGIIRSLRFGFEKAIERETFLSVATQLIVIIAFFIHALYAFILYFLGGRDSRLLYFSLLVISIVFFISLTNDDKVLFNFVPINYDWSFKLTPFSLVISSFSLVMSVKNELPIFWRKKIQFIFSLLCGIFIFILFFLPTENIFPFANVSFLISLLGLFIAAFALLPTAVKKINEHLLIIVALIALANDMIWASILRLVGLKILYYPIDLVIAIVAFSSIWFNQYFQNYRKTQDLAAQLQRINETKDQFLANTSHELRNPLHGIINITQAVLEREQASLNEKSIQDLDSVIAVGRRMSHTLNDLLDIMYLKESKITLQKSATNIHKVASGIVKILTFMTEGKAIRIENRIPEHFPLVHADENRLIQILFNLLHNAVKFTNQGKVSISARIEEKRAYISVLDTGIGMSETLIKRIFEPYEQARQNETSIEGGLGLGLSICQQLVELHDSKLDVQSTLEKGSVFSFYLDICEACDEQYETYETELQRLYFDEMAITIQSDEHPSNAKPLNNTRPRILAVDDDPLNLKILQTILPETDYHVVTVTSAEEALKLVHTQPWHLMILDVVMPNMSGYELTVKVRERFSLLDLPIILLTSHVSTENIEYGFFVGANDYVGKPIDTKILRARVKALTDLQLSLNERLRMESALLQAQIRPHFLYNTLNSIAALSQIDSERMLKLLNEFSNYLRASFDFDNQKKLVPIEHELNLVRSYLYIEKERFGDILNVHFAIDEAIQFSIPPLTIQPLVENAVKHGILKKERGGTITIRITEKQAFHKVSIEDDGVGISEEVLKNWKNKAGVGLINTHKRLMKQFGHGLEITSQLEKGTTVSFFIDKD